MTEAETTELFAALHEAPDRHRSPARAALIVAHRDEAERVANFFTSRWQHRGATHDEARAVAALALIRAVDGFDPDRRNTFAAYMGRTVYLELTEYFDRHTRAVTVPYADLKAARRAHQGQDPGIDVDRLEAVRATGQADQADALPYWDTPWLTHDPWMTDPGPAAVDARDAIGAALDRLTGPERRAVMMRFGLDGEGGRTNRAMGQALDCSHESARQLWQGAVAKLREWAEGDGRRSVTPATDTRPAAAHPPDPTARPAGVKAGPNAAKQGNTSNQARDTARRGRIKPTRVPR